MLKKHDFVICLETGEMGEILAVFSIARVRVRFPSGECILDTEDIMMIEEKNNDTVSTPHEK
jgi:hypothetical protein|tara:strand:+ start:9437 stop:9622 length:186 start_codon:yes stop_codon:yes gene_type:complete